MSEGRFAEAMPLLEKAHSQRPYDSAIAIWLAYGLWATHQYERAAALATQVNWIKLAPLKMLGDRDEAILLAKEEAANGDIIPLFILFPRLGQSAHLVRYLESRWSDLDALQADRSQQYEIGVGNEVMLWTAFAYQTIGNDDRFRDAMARYRVERDLLKSQGINSSFWFELVEAFYYTMAADQDRAIAHLDTAVSKGFIAGTRLADNFPMLKPLEGDPRYEAIQARMTENLNTQRAAFGLGPAEI